MAQQSRKHVIIFGLIGVFNTAFDLLLYLVIYNLTKSVLLANTISTAAALVGSYFLNGRLTFKGRRMSHRTFISFIIVTLFGLWVLQSLVIIAIMPLTNKLPAALFSWLGPQLARAARTLLPKILATSVTLVWNYTWYNKVIFRPHPRSR